MTASKRPTHTVPRTACLRPNRTQSTTQIGAVNSMISAMPIGMPAIATTVILNFISLWYEFLYAVVLITDESKRTLPLGIQKFMGDQLEDIGMISTGLMIAIVPVIIIYAFFSERLIQGMTAGAVK